MDDKGKLMGEPVKEALPICVYFDKDRVLERMEEIYRNHGRHNEARRNEPLQDEPVYM
jgi:hypothetical protein